MVNAKFLMKRKRLVAIILTCGVVVICTPFILEELRWRRAISEGTMESLERYIEAYPSRRVSETREIIDNLKWKQAVFDGTIQSFEQYLAAYPTGDYAYEAIKGINEARVEQLMSTAGSLCDTAFSSPIEEGASIVAPLLALRKRDYGSDFYKYFPKEDPSWQWYPLPHIGAISGGEVGTLVCIKEHRLKEWMTTYRRVWDVRLVRWPEGQVIASTSLRGGDPPSVIYYQRDRPVPVRYGPPPRLELVELLYRLLGWSNMQAIVVWGKVIAFSPDGRLLATSDGEDKSTTRLWQLSDGTCVRTLEGGPGEGMAFSPDGNLLVSGGRLWRLSDGTCVREIGDFESVAFSPDGELLATSDGEYKSTTDGEYKSTTRHVYKSTTRLCQLSDGTCVRTLEGGHGEGMAFSPDGNLLVSGGRLWRLSDGTCVREIGDFESVAFSPDGELLAAAESDGAHLWRVSDGKRVHTLHLDYGEKGLAISSDGLLLISGSSSRDGTVRLLRVSDGAVLNTLRGHTEAVWSVAFSPVGRILVSSASDGTVRVWRLPALKQ